MIGSAKRILVYTLKIFLEMLPVLWLAHAWLVAPSGSLYIYVLGHNGCVCATVCIAFIFWEYGVCRQRNEEAHVKAKIIHYDMSILYRDFDRFYWVLYKKIHREGMYVYKIDIEVCNCNTIKVL